MIALTKVQLPVLVKIQEFLENNLGFDKYSKFKLLNSSAISVIENQAVNNSKPMVRLTIFSTNILMNYFFPFLYKMTFITKKGEDFRDLQIICAAIYKGAHREEEMKALILKLSYTMNNYRLSSQEESARSISLPEEELNRLINVKPTILHLADGRQLDILTRKDVNKHGPTCIYEIILKSGKGSVKVDETILVSTLKEAGEILKVNYRTVKRQLDSLPEQELGRSFVEIKGNKVRRVAVFLT